MMALNRLHTTLLVVTFLLYTSSSAECSTNIFYEYMYCLSMESECSQCIPCYNDNEFFVSSETESISLCDDSQICGECVQHCYNLFNANKYNENMNEIDNDGSCATLPQFISNMNTFHITDLSAKSSLIIDCDDERDFVSIKYGIVTSANSDSKRGCTLDISAQLKDSCDNQRSCNFSDFLTCQKDGNVYQAHIGIFCIASATNRISPSDLAEFTTCNPLETLPSYFYIYLIITMITSCIVAFIFILIYWHWLRDCKFCRKHLSGTRETLTNSPKNEVIDASVSVDGHVTGSKKESPISPMSIIRSNSIQYDVKPSSKYQNMQRGNYAHQHSIEKKSILKNMSPRGRIKGLRGISVKDVVRTNTSLTAKDDRSPHGMTIIPTTNGWLSTFISLHILAQHGTYLAHIRNSSVKLDGMTIPKPIHENGNWPIYDPAYQSRPATMHVNPVMNSPITSQIYGQPQKRHPMDTTMSIDMDLANMQQKFQAEHNEIAQALMFPNGHSPTNAYNMLDSNMASPYTPNLAQAQYFSNPPAANNTSRKPDLQNDFSHQPNTTGMEYIFDFTDTNDLMMYDFANPNGDSYDDSKIECIEHNEVQFEAELGVGTSSKVFKARWRNTEVAAKRFIKDFGKDHKKSKEYIDKYATKLLESPHENVIKIFAFCNNPFQLLTEYMNYGSVKNYVRRSRPGSTSISILDRIEISLQAAKGVKHLHSLGIIHSEITCQNLMMEFVDGNAKNIRVAVTDYALQQMLSDDALETYRSTLGPLKWMAPECIENANPTLASDVYSFSITMWEIITGQEPYPDVAPVDTAIHVLVKGRRPQSYAFIPEKIQNLLKLMWQKEPEKRPNAEEVVAMLTEFVEIEHKLIEDGKDLI